MAEAAKEYAAGLAAGIATVITGHPFDTVKVKGLYRGATPSFIGMAFESSLLFGIYSQMKQSLQRGEVTSSRPDLRVIIPAAAYGGAVISFILCPAELVKCRMQVQGTDSAISKHGRYSGPIDCALKKIQNNGIKGIFRGGFATLLRESFGNALFFTIYELSRYHMHLQLDTIFDSANNQPKLLIDVGVGIASGGLAGVAFWSSVLPLDVAKTVIQTSSDPSSTRNPFQILSSIHKRVGLSGCYAGLGPTLIRAFPANAAAIVTWELAAKILGVKRD